MPRDGAGVYTLPAGNPVVSGTIISSVWANTTLSDISTQLNNVLTRDGLLSPTAPFKVLPGSAALPGLVFTTATTTGFYLPAADQIGFACAGLNRAILSATGFNITNGLTVGGSSTLNGLTTITSAVTNPLTVVGTAAAASVISRLANTSGTAGSIAAFSLDPGNNGFNTRDFSIRVSNGGTNILTTSFWTANGAPPVEVWRLTGPGDLQSMLQTNTLHVGGTGTSYPIAITRTAALGEMFRITGTSGTACGLGVTASDTMNFYTGGVSRFRYNQSDGLLITTQGCVGYGAGAGGTVTQLTSKATGVTLDKQSGLITLNASNIPSASEVSFVVTNSVCTATDTVVVNRANGGSDTSYIVWCDSVSAGSFRIAIRNVTGAGLAQSFVVAFSIIRGSST